MENKNNLVKLKQIKEGIELEGKIQKNNNFLEELNNSIDDIMSRLSKSFENLQNL